MPSRQNEHLLKIITSFYAFLFLHLLCVKITSLFWLIVLGFSFGRTALAGPEFLLLSIYVSRLEGRSGMKPEDVTALFAKYQAIGAQKPERPKGPLAGTLPSVAARSKALQQQLTDDEKDFIQYLVSALPPVIGRAEVDRFLPGLIKPQTLAHADSAGLGPEVAWKVGRKVAYRTDSLVLWLVGRCGISKLVSVNKFINLS